MSHFAVVLTLVAAWLRKVQTRVRLSNQSYRCAPRLAEAAVALGIENETVLLINMPERATQPFRSVSAVRFHCVTLSAISRVDFSAAWLSWA
jgi:hypothetical protein